MSSSLQPSSVHESTFSRYRYPLLIGTYALVTGLAFLRISRQPYGQGVKWEQYETVFKFTSFFGRRTGRHRIGWAEKEERGGAEDVN